MATASPGIITLQDVNGLAGSLADAIQTGNVGLAKDLVAQFSTHRLKLKINVLDEQIGQQCQEKEFSVNIHMEDRKSTGTKFQLLVKSTFSIADMKKKVWLVYSIPTEIQRWVIGKKIPDDTMTLGKCGVNCAGHTLFVYIVTPLQELELGSDHCGGGLDYSMYSSSAMSNTLYHSEKGRYSELLLMDDYDDSDTIQNQFQTAKSTLIKEPRDDNGPPPPIPERVPLQNQWMESDSSEETKVVWEHLNQVIPPPPQRKKEQVKQPPGWQCPQCTYFNFPSRPGCEMCATDRPEDYVAPDGYEMTDTEVAMLAHQQELEQLTRQDHQDALRDNFRQLCRLDTLDLIQNTEAFTCPICFDGFEPGEGVILRDCLHQFCKDCIQGSLIHSEDPILKCPYQDDVSGCESVLQEREIRALVPEDLFIKYLQRSLDQAEAQAPNSFHCKTANCKGWCIYEDEVNFFVCPICTKENCLTCKVIHEGMNCKEYQRDLEIKAANDEAARGTQALIQNMLNDGSAMLCPQCKIILQKKDGCDWIKCSVCKTEICWVTKGPRWGPKGNGDTSGGCRCGVERKRCHANCGNCH